MSIAALIFVLCSIRQGIGQVIFPSPVARVLYGDPLQLTCHLGSDWTSMVWDRAGFGWALTAFPTSCGLHKPQIGYYITCQGETVQLRHTTPVNGHSYQCVKFKGNNKTTSITTTVEIYIDGPYLETNHKVMSVREKERAELVCKAKGGPNITVTWTQANSTEILPSRSTPQGTVLTIDNLSRDHAGNYTCQGSFAYKGRNYQNQTSMGLDVLYAPSVTIQGGGIVRGGNSTTLLCITTGNPPPEYVVWKHYVGSVLVRQLNGSNGLHGNELELSEVEYQDRGMYVCAASNGVMVDNQMEQTSSTEITVQHSPIWLDNNVSSDYFEEKSTQVKISFRYIAHPSSSPPVLKEANTNKSIINDTRVTMLYSKSQTLLSIYDKQIKKEVYTVNIKFSPILGSDSGEYVLKIANDVSSVERSFSVHALDKPTLPSDVRSEVQSYTNITLHWSYKYQIDKFLSFLITCQTQTDDLSYGEKRLFFNKTQPEYMYKVTKLRPDTWYTFKICAENPLGKRCTTTLAERTDDVIPGIVVAPAAQRSVKSGEDNTSNGTGTIVAISVSAGVVVLICILIAVKLKRRRRRTSAKFRASVSYEADSLNRGERTAIANFYGEKPALPARENLGGCVYEQIPADLKLHSSQASGNTEINSNNGKEKKKSKKYTKKQGRPVSTTYTEVQRFSHLQNEYSSLIMTPDNPPIRDNAPVSDLNMKSMDSKTHRDGGENSSDLLTKPKNRNTYMEMGENKHTQGSIRCTGQSLADTERTDMLEKCGYIAMNKVAGGPSQESLKETTKKEEEGRFDAYRY